jgi:hypothetical protein
MRLYRCAVCGNENYIGYELCKNCWSEWTVTGTISKPTWLLELVKMEYSFQSTKAATEIAFVDMPPAFQMSVGYSKPELDTD